MKDKVVPNNSQVKDKKIEVEDRHSISIISNKTKYVTTCNDSLKSNALNVNAVCATCGKCLIDLYHFACVTEMLNDVNARTLGAVVSIRAAAVDVDIEPAELQEVVEVVTTAKLITEVVAAASATITVAALQLTTAAALILTTAPSAARRRKGVVIRDPEKTATQSTIIHTEAQSKDKGKGILVEEPKPLKKQAQIKQDEAYARELEAEQNKNIDCDEVIDNV
nr:hypothetical protein [Tanacetum cinerariifolium]